MSHPLDGAVEKIHRADKHFQALERSIRQFLGTKPYALRGEINTEQTEATFWVKATRPCRPWWGPAIGDIVHNLRSALDNVAYQLAWKRGTLPYPRTEFPIFASEDLFFEKSKKGTWTRASGMEKIQSLGPGGRRFVQGCQPYHRGDQATSSPLWQLRELSNADKHRVPAVAGHALVAGPTGMDVGPGLELLDWKFDGSGRLDEGAKVGTAKFKATVKGPVDFKPTLTFGIVFDEATGAAGEPLPSNGLEVLGSLRAQFYDTYVVVSEAQTLFPGRPRLPRLG